MARRATKGLTEAEQQIMRILWEKGEASVREVTDILSEDRPTAYTTALTMLRILSEKGYATYRKEGRAFIYRALVSEGEARSSALKRLLSNFFNDSPEALAQHLVKEDEVNLDTLESLRAVIDQAVKVRDGGEA